MARWIRALARGMRHITIWPRPTRTPYTGRDPERADRDAIASDWRAVMGDLDAARRKVETEAELMAKLRDAPDLIRERDELRCQVERLTAERDEARARAEGLAEALTRVLMWAPRSTEAACEQDYEVARAALEGDTQA